MASRKLKAAALVLVIVIMMGSAAYAANGTVISVTSSSVAVSPGDIVDVTVAFAPLASGNISILELCVPIDTNAFAYVEGSAKKFLESTQNTISAAAFRQNASDVFCNWVDITSAIGKNTTAIYAFKLKVNDSAANGTYPLNLEAKSFITDADGKGISFTAQGTAITVKGSSATEKPPQQSDSPAVENTFLPESPLITTEQVSTPVSTPQDGTSAMGYGVSGGSDAPDTVLWIVLGLIAGGAVIAILIKAILNKKKG